MIDKRHKDGLKLSNLAHLVFPDISESLDWSVVFFSFSVGKYFCFSFQEQFIMGSASAVIRRLWKVKDCRLPVVKLKNTFRPSRNSIISKYFPVQEE